MTADIANNLPVALSSFIGREREVAEVQRLLSGARLLTLTGSGGVGKTRLALRVASGLVGAGSPRAYADGVWFVELAPLSDPALIASTIAAAAGIREEPNRPILESLGDYLRVRDTLVVLDNCEHLIAGAAQICDTLLHAAPHLKVMATSREPLGIAGEHTYRVPSLDLPADAMVPELVSHVASVQLFTERAKAARSDFALTPANASAIAQICRRLDGIPLAIELAAARVRSLSVEQVAARLDDRFRLLTGGSRTALARQQTLRATIDWSYALLTEKEQLLLRRLSVFAGGWTLEAAEEVTTDEQPVRTDEPSEPGANYLEQSTLGPSSSIRLYRSEVLDLMSRLIEKSLVVLDEQAGEARYHVLETQHQYAAEKLAEQGEANAVNARHMAYFTRFAEDARVGLWTSDDVGWIGRLSADLDNWRAAFDRAIARGLAAPALRMLGAFFWFALFFGQYTNEALARARKALAVPGAAQRDAMHAQGLLVAGGTLTWSWRGNSEEGAACLREAAQIARECNAGLIAAEALLHLGAAETTLKRYAEAMAVLDEALLVTQRIGNDNIEALVYVYRGMAYLESGRPDAARENFSSGRAILARVGSANMHMMTVRFDGYASLALGDEAGASASFRYSLDQNTYPHFDPKGTAACLVAFGALGLAQGDPASAVRLCAAAQALLDANVSEIFPFDHRRYEHTLARAHMLLKNADFDQAWTEGQLWTLARATAETRRIATAPAPSSAAPGNHAVGLTAREADVLRLLAQGLTDAQIAETLVISTRTVNSHLRSIYGKLDVTTRTAAVRAAIDLKLA